MEKTPQTPLTYNTIQGNQTTCRKGERKRECGGKERHTTATCREEMDDWEEYKRNKQEVKRQRRALMKDAEGGRGSVASTGNKK